MPIVAVVGAAFSIYEGVQQEKAAKANEAKGDAATAKAESAAAADKQWYDQNVRPFLTKTVLEGQSDHMSAAGLASQDKFLKGVGDVQRRIDQESGQALGSDSGLTASKNLTLALDKAKGLGEINLNDAISRKQQALQAAQLGGQGSQAAAELQGAYGMEERQASLEQELHQKQADASWQSVSKGLMSVADSYADPDNTATGLDWWMGKTS